MPTTPDQPPLALEFVHCSTPECPADPVPGTDRCSECISGEPDVIVELEP